jgi:hypothetical protein
MVTVTASSTEATTDGADALERANDRIRGAAKWLIASSAAVGAALIAGSQLSSIGKLEVGLPTSVEQARLWIACIGAITGLVGVVFAIWISVQILLPKTVFIRDLDLAWDGRERSLAPIVDFFKKHPDYLQDFASPYAITEEFDRLTSDRRRVQEELATGAVAVSAVPWHKFSERRALLQKQDALRSSAEELDAQISDIESRIESIEDTATHEALKAEFRTALRGLLVASAIVALGIVSFAWAANPPAKSSPSADLRNSDLSGANLRDAKLGNARLDNANLTGADLTGRVSRGSWNLSDDPV